MIDSQMVHKAVRNPAKAAKYIRLQSRLKTEVGLRKINQRIHQIKGRPESFDLMGQDWDTAIILDACRFDYFEQENIFDEEVEKKIAPGGASQEFIREMFMGRKLHDTVYVTGNPFVRLLEIGTFHDRIQDETWDVGNSQAPPELVTEAAIKAHREYPNKRIIVHYMQPHLPIHDPDYKFVNEGLHWEHDQYWPISVSRQDLRDGYRANLRFVLSYVKELMNIIDGKVILTADHGELLGEQAQPIPVRTYNHYTNLYVPELLEIPWLELDSDDRRKVQSDPPNNNKNSDQADHYERLEALGYVQ